MAVISSRQVHQRPAEIFVELLAQQGGYAGGTQRETTE